MEFSTSSLTIDAGLSTTSPAAILLAISEDKTSMRFDNFFSRSSSRPGFPMIIDIMRLRVFG